MYLQKILAGKPLFESTVERLATFVDLFLLVTINICPQKSNKLKLFVERIIWDQNGNSNVTPSPDNAKCQSIPFINRSQCVSFQKSFQCKRMDIGDWFLFHWIGSTYGNGMEMQKNWWKHHSEIWPIYHVDNIGRKRERAKKRANVTHAIWGADSNKMHSIFHLYRIHSLPWNTM